ncbi:MAG: hypothetical protein E7544_01865 [Ruminococcaceae bacterium]|nr:hypothetical protein [Oscillospiraceae bacterium]
MNVIFLDIDGVLNTEKTRLENEEYFDKPISEVHMSRLEKLVKSTGSVIVLTSTWRVYWNHGLSQVSPIGDYINDIFAKHRVAIYGKTLEFSGNDRKAEIDDWFERYKSKVENYVIIDDVDYGFDKSHFVQTSDAKGLDDEACDKAYRILHPVFTEINRDIDKEWDEIKCLVKDDYIIDEVDFDQFKYLDAEGYFNDSKTLLLNCDLYKIGRIKKNYKITLALEAAVKAVFGEDSKYIIDVSDPTSEDDGCIHLSGKMMYNPFLAYEEVPDVKAYKMRKALCKKLAVSPRSIFGAEPFKEMLYRVLLIFVNAAKNGITDYISVKRKDSFIEIYCADNTEFLVERASDVQLFASCDYDKNLTFNCNKNKKYPTTPFYKCSSNDSKSTANTDGDFSLFSLIYLSDYVCFESVRNGKNKCMTYVKLVTDGIEEIETDLNDGTYITFKCNHFNLSSLDIIEVAEMMSAVFGVKISFFYAGTDDRITYDYKNITDYLDAHKKGYTESCYSKIEAGGKDRFDASYYNASVEFAFALSRERNISKTLYNYSLTDNENIYADKVFEVLTEKFNALLGKVTGRGVLTKDDVKNHMNLVLNITDDDLAEATLNGKSPQFRRMLDDMIEVLIEENVTPWIKKNEFDIIKWAFEVFEEKDIIDVVFFTPM